MGGKCCLLGQGSNGPTYLGVFLLNVDLTLWESELLEGVLTICCSGVVSGPNMLTLKQEDTSIAP